MSIKCRRFSVLWRDICASFFLSFRLKTAFWLARALSSFRCVLFPRKQRENLSKTPRVERERERRVLFTAFSLSSSSLVRFFSNKNNNRHTPFTEKFFVFFVCLLRVSVFFAFFVFSRTIETREFLRRKLPFGGVLAITYVCARIRHFKAP